MEENRWKTWKIKTNQELRAAVADEAPEIWETIFNLEKNKGPINMNIVFELSKNFHSISNNWWAIATLDKMLATLKDVSKWAGYNATKFPLMMVKCPSVIESIIGHRLGGIMWRGMSVKLKNGIHGNTVCCGGMHVRLYTVSTSVNGVGSRKAGGEKKNTRYHPYI